MKNLLSATLIMMSIATTWQHDFERAQYSEQSALQQARLSQAAYCPVEYIENKLDSFLTDFTVINEPDCHILAVVGLRDEHLQGPVPQEIPVIQVIFRGTNGLDLNNWLTNFDSRLVQFNSPGLQNGYVHEGFMKAYASVQKRVQDTVEALKKKGISTIYVTGHSLGGALATIAAITLQQEHTEMTVRLTTFGSPRVGNNAFAQYVSQTLASHFRVTHAHDIITHLPMQIQGYTHINTEIWYPNPAHDSVYKQCDTTFFDIQDTNIVIHKPLNIDLSIDMLLATELMRQTENIGCANSVIPWMSIQQHRMYIGFDITDISTCGAEFFAIVSE